MVFVNKKMANKLSLKYQKKKMQSNYYQKCDVTRKNQTNI